MTKGTASFDGIFSSIVSFKYISSNSFSLSLKLFIVSGKFSLFNEFISEESFESEEICSRMLSFRLIGFCLFVSSESSSSHDLALYITSIFKFLFNDI